jgi:hypothetical protein
MLGSNWLWNRVSYRWMVSTQAACLYGLATVFICLLTAYWFGVITPGESNGFVAQVLWGSLGILSPLSIIFLWAGMRRYQEFREVRDPELVGKSKSVRFLLSVGIWYGAMIYYLLVYLSARRHPKMESLGEHVS